MATGEQIEVLLELMRKAPPSEQFQNIDKNTMGIRAILKYLYETDGRVTAGKISEHMKVSTARVAVLLKKMVAKGLIERESDSEDGRIVVVRLSEYGRQSAYRLRENIYKTMGEIIDRVGMDRMLEFAEISNEIHDVLKNAEIEI
ncbi:MAG: MarR family transcriptional regulator [Ruminococcaceae bacterium]|nr:MarR family transcriptional regulator [Oscillospiraceae bacterium]